jgi:hypothetical protein
LAIIYNLINQQIQLTGLEKHIAAKHQIPVPQLPPPPPRLAIEATPQPPTQQWEVGRLQQGRGVGGMSGCLYNYHQNLALHVNFKIGLN